MVPGQTHGLHDLLCLRHVKRHLIHAGQGFESGRIACHTRVVSAQNRPQGLRFGKAFGHGLLVEISTKDVDSVRARQVVENLSVQVGDLHASCRLQKRADFEVLTHQRTELEWHPISRNELHVRDVVSGRCGRCNAEFVARLQSLGQGKESAATLRLNVFRRTIAAEELLFAVAVARQPSGQALGHARVTCERTVLGPRQLNALTNGWCQCSQSAQTDPCGVHN